MEKTMNNEYVEKVFYDICICWLFANKLKQNENQNDIRTAVLPIEFVYENGVFIFQTDDFKFNLGNILMYHDFRQFMVNQMINYGFSVVVDNHAHNDVFASLIEKGHVSESILFVGTIDQMQLIMDMENSKHAKTMIK